MTGTTGPYHCAVVALHSAGFNTLTTGTTGLMSFFALSVSWDALAQDANGSIQPIAKPSTLIFLSTLKSIYDGTDRLRQVRRHY